MNSPFSARAGALVSLEVTAQKISSSHLTRPHCHPLTFEMCLFEKKRRKEDKEEGKIICQRCYILLGKRKEWLALQRLEGVACWFYVLFLFVLAFSCVSVLLRPHLLV